MGDVNSLKGMHSLRTRNKPKKRSIPGTETLIYLDLYMLDKEKERLMKEDEKLCMRKAFIMKRIGEIDMEMNRLQGTDVADKLAPAFMTGNSAGSPWECIPDTSNRLVDFPEIKKGWKKIYLGY